MCLAVWLRPPGSFPASPLPLPLTHRVTWLFCCSTEARIWSRVLSFLFSHLLKKKKVLQSPSFRLMFKFSGEYSRRCLTLTPLALLAVSCLLRGSLHVFLPGIWRKWKCLQGSPGYKTLRGCGVTLMHGIDPSVVFRKSLQCPEVTFYFKTHSLTLVTHS